MITNKAKTIHKTWYVIRNLCWQLFYYIFARFRVGFTVLGEIKQKMENNFFTPFICNYQSSFVGFTQFRAICSAQFSFYFLSAYK